MKFQDLLKDEIDSLGDDHLGSSINNPIKKDAFKISNSRKSLRYTRHSGNGS